MVSNTTFLATHALRDLLTQKGIHSGITALSFPDIAEIREIATTIWYDGMPNISHMLFIDADMGFEPQLVLDMLAFGEPVVGAIYPQRRLPTSWAGSGCGGPMTERRGDFMKVEGTGFGITLIHREAIRIMLEKFPELVDNRIDLHPAKELIKSGGANRLLRLFEKKDIPERGLVSEDLSFCIRWAQCGGEVWANIGHRISHVGPHDFAARYLDTVELNQRAADDAAFTQQSLQIDPIFTAPEQPSVPMPGMTVEMPGGPSYQGLPAHD